MNNNEEIKLTENAEKILKARYYTKPNGVIETWEGLCWRVARSVAAAEKTTPLREEWTEKFYHMIYNQEMLPNSPTLMNCGKEVQMLSACFVLPIEDSIEGIFDAMKWGAMVHMRGGGTGYAFSKLRGKGALVNSSKGQASGPISFMTAFDAATATIAQGGTRRGANMAVLDVHHPDILDFIRCKTETDKLNNFNISVAVTDKFITAIRNGDELENEIFDAIVYQSWLNAEPGILFIDTINAANPTPHVGKYEACNPCQPEHASILDGEYIRRIDEVKDTCTSAYTATKEVLELKLNNGMKIQFTPDHKLMTADGGWVEAQDSIDVPLKWGLGDRTADEFYNDTIVQGFLFGDGFRCGGGCGCSVKLNKNKEKEIYAMLIDIGFKKEECGSLYLNRESLPFGESFLDYRVFDRQLPSYVYDAESNTTASFLRGLFEANGSVTKASQISLKATCLGMVEDVQILLASFGIPSWITVNTSRKVHWNNGDYISKESYNLQIAPRNSSIFKEKIGFISEYKNYRIRDIAGTYSTKLKVVSIESIGEKAVWDYTMNTPPHYNFCQGVIAANCGEQMLLPMESCNLGSINLTKFIVDGSFDWNKLRTCVETSIRFLDNVIDVSDHPLPEIKEMTEANRKCGLGVMGFADALIELEVVYGSKDSLTLAENVMSFIDTNAYKYSIDLAEEKGEYPNYVYSDFTPVPTRNACRTSIQPTGTVSIIANCSSGIEPIFALKLTRNSFDGAFDDEYYQPFYDFMKNLRLDDRYISKIAEEGVMKNPTKTNCPQFITAHEISPESHVRMLATFQENVDSGISKTINMPNDASEEDVRQAILLAYDLKCKGVSVYRDGSRVQVLENASKIAVPTTIDTPILTFTRPRTLNGKTTKILTGCGALYVTISYDDNGMPQEVFSHLGKGGACSHSSCEAIGRLSSVILQNDIGVPTIVKQLQGIRCPIPRIQEGGTVLSCADAIGKVLAELITDASTINSISANDETGHTQFCPECGNEMVFNQGCANCSNCGHSKCG